MKATFQIPDALYREVKAETAREGRSVREVTISLFEQWLRQKNQVAPIANPVDWQNFQPPLAHLVPADALNHESDAIRNSISKNWNEPS